MISTLWRCIILVYELVTNVKNVYTSWSEPEVQEMVPSLQSMTHCFRYHPFKTYKIYYHCLTILVRESYQMVSSTEINVSTSSCIIMYIT